MTSFCNGVQKISDHFFWWIMLFLLEYCGSLWHWARDQGPNCDKFWMIKDMTIGLKESHGHLFEILENYHCLRIHGSGAIQDLIVGLTFFWTRMNYEYVTSWMCFRVSHWFENTEHINRWKVVYAACASAMISPLKQYLAPCAKLA